MEELISLKDPPAPPTPRLLAAKWMSSFRDSDGSGVDVKPAVSMRIDQWLKKSLDQIILKALCLLQYTLFLSVFLYFYLSILICLSLTLYPLFCPLPPVSFTLWPLYSLSSWVAFPTQLSTLIPLLSLSSSMSTSLSCILCSSCLFYLFSGLLFSSLPSLSSSFSILQSLSSLMSPSSYILLSLPPFFLYLTLWPFLT